MDIFNVSFFTVGSLNDSIIIFRCCWCIVFIIVIIQVKDEMWERSH